MKKERDVEKYLKLSITSPNFMKTLKCSGACYENDDDEEDNDKYDVNQSDLTDPKRVSVCFNPQISSQMFGSCRLQYLLRDRALAPTHKHGTFAYRLSDEVVRDINDLIKRPTNNRGSAKSLS